MNGFRSLINFCWNMWNYSKLSSMENWYHFISHTFQARSFNCPGIAPIFCVRFLTHGRRYGPISIVLWAWEGIELGYAWNYRASGQNEIFFDYGIYDILNQDEPLILQKSLQFSSLNARPSSTELQLIESLKWLSFEDAQRRDLCFYSNMLIRFYLCKNWFKQRQRSNSYCQTGSWQLKFWLYWRKSRLWRNSALYETNGGIGVVSIVARNFSQTTKNVWFVIDPPVMVIFLFGRNP